MIGITYCGLVGKGTKVDGTLLGMVECTKCRKVDADPERFTQVTPLTINQAEMVHAGSLTPVVDQENRLYNIQVQIINGVLDPKNVASITAILDIERAFVADRAATEQAEERQAELDAEVKRLRAEAEAKAKQIS